MALTTTQVNQAFLATLGRPAEGSAATWGSTSLSLDTLLDSIFIAENTDGDFVEYLYQNILGRASDAEGKAFWNSLLATTSKEAVLAQFKAAVIAAGQADPANADYQSFIAQNKAFVTELYTNLLGRSDAASADAEGVEFWANALASGTSKGALLAQFTAAALSDPNSDDAQTLNAKVNVANAITAKFNNFNTDVTADQKKAALDALKATMTEVVAGSTTEDFQERIDTFAGNYQNRVAQVFTTKDDDQLDASEATASTVFSGNVNLVDSTKGTIQTTDSVAGNSNYTDTLRVSVTSDSANKDFNLTSNLPTSVSSIEKLIITAGAANVSGTLDGNNYAESTTITSTGDVDLKIGGVQKELKVTAGDKKDAAITVNSGSLDNYTGSAAKDTINVKAGSVKTIDTGAGKDVVTIASGAKIENEGSIKLGAGDDELTIVSTLLAKTDTLNKISLDGGEGSKDKLTISTDITAVNSITGFETIDASGATISADAANSLTSGTKLSNGSDLKIDMSDKNSLNLKNLKVGNNADNKLGTASVAIDGVAKGEITLTSTTNNAIVETITLAQTEDGKTGSVTINGIGAAKLDASGGRVDGSSGDKLAITGITLTGIEQIKNYKKLPDTLTANKVYYINTAISSADDLSSKGTVLSFVGDNTTLTNGSKTLVALNNSAQNTSYVFEISSTGNKVTRDDITLKAIVDNAINSKDDITVSGEIEFVAGTEDRDLTPSATVAYAKLNDKALVIGTTKVDGRVIDFDSKKSITVTGVNDQLTVTANGPLTAEHKININASGDVSFAVTGVVGDSVNTLVLDNNKGITNAATLANIDVVKLNGKNAINSNVSGATITGTDAAEELTISGASSGNEIDLSSTKINLGAGDDYLTVRFANISGATIDLGAGNDTIDIASILKSAYLQGTTINGGDDRDTMLVIANTAEVVFNPKELDLTLENIEVLQVKGLDNSSSGGQDKSSKLSVSAVNGEKLTLTKHSPTNGTLELVATNKDTSIDLSKLNNDTVPGETKLDALTLSGVASGATVTLNKDDGIAETIKLAANAAGVTINGFTATVAKDVINLKTVGVTAIDSAKIYSSSDKIGSLTASKLYYSSVAVDAGGDNKLDAGFVNSITDKALTSGSSIYAAEVGDNATKIYKITSSSTSLATDDTVSLIATLNTALAANGGNIIA